MSALIETIRMADRITISIPTAGLSNEKIQRLIDLIKADAIVAKSVLAQEEADEIARDINRSWWNKNKARIEKMVKENE